MNDRRSIRKRGHDYAAPGHYFVTLCVRNRDPLLGGIDAETMILSEMGLVVREEWQVLPQRFPMVGLDAFTVMPNHVHGIIAIVDPLANQTGLTGGIRRRPVLVCRRFGRGRAPPLRWVP